MYLHFLCINMPQKPHICTHVAILMVWRVLYRSNLQFTDWRVPHIILQLSLEFVTKVIFVPSVNQTLSWDWDEHDTNRRGLICSVDWHPLRALLVNMFGSRSQNLRVSPFLAYLNFPSQIYIYIPIYPFEKERYPFERDIYPFQRESESDRSREIYIRSRVIYAF